jgi:transketolase
LEDPQRDYLFLSKGHDVPALYGTLVEVGILESGRLLNHLNVNDDIYWHPNRAIPGIEYYSGSLGHLLSVAIGVALDCKLKQSENKIVVILGDGELNEGSIWEGLLVASAYKLDNLLVIVDRNHFQANIQTEDLVPLEPLENKFESFGWVTNRINGHSFFEIHESLWDMNFSDGWPKVLIADTIRGKGLPSIEQRADRWFCNFSYDEIDQLLDELHGKKQSIIKSESLIVR